MGPPPRAHLLPHGRGAAVAAAIQPAHLRSVQASRSQQLSTLSKISPPSITSFSWRRRTALSITTLAHYEDTGPRTAIRTNHLTDYPSSIQVQAQRRCRGQPRPFRGVTPALLRQVIASLMPII